MAIYDWRDILKHGSPMAAARKLRRDKYTWPGGYAMGLLMSEGDILCPECVTAEYRLISSAHRSKFRYPTGCQTGWEPVGAVAECDTDETEYCGQCNRVLFNANEEA